MIRSVLLISTLLFFYNLEAEEFVSPDKSAILARMDKQIKETEKQLKTLVENYNKVLRGEEQATVDPVITKSIEERVTELEKQIDLLKDVNSTEVKAPLEQNDNKKKTLPDPNGFKLYSAALAIWHRAEKENNKAVALQAADSFEKFTNAYPNDFYHVHALVYQGKCFAFAGEVARAEKTYNKALDQYLREKNPDHKTILAHTHFDLAKLHHKVGKISEAKNRADFILKHYKEMLTPEQKLEIEKIANQIISEKGAEKK